MSTLFAKPPGSIDPRYVRTINRETVFTLLRKNDNLSISALSRLARLSISSVRAVLDDLIDLNLVQKAGPGSSTGGRQPALFSLNRDNLFVCGIEIKTNHLSLGIFELDGSRIWRSDCPVDTLSPDQLVDTAIAYLEKGFRDLELSNENLLGIGLCTPGVPDALAKVITLAVDFKWEDLPLGTMLEKRTGVPVFLFENANAKMIAEHEYGSAKELENFIYLLIGSNRGMGIGCGLFFRGEMIEGEHGMAGEVGHICVEPDGPYCYCGRRGCWEAVAGINRMIEKLNQAIPDLNLQSPEQLGARLPELLKSDAKAEQIYSWFIETQARVTSNLVMMLNPEAIVIGGEITLLGTGFVERFRKSVAAKLPKPFHNRYRIELGTIEHDGGILGAAAMLLKNAIAIKQQAKE